MSALHIKSILFAGIIILSGIVNPAYVISSQASETTPVLPVSSSVTMQVTYGYDNTAKGGRYIPVQVSLNNTAELFFKGQLQIMSMESDYEIYRYDYPVEIEGNTSIEKLVNIPIGNQSDQLFVSLTDANGKEMLRKRLKLNTSQDTAQLIVGILSDTPDLLSYFNGVGIDYSRLKTKTFNFTKSSFPEEEIGLDLVDVILISNYRIRDLSERQTQVLMEWVKSGNTLILGTGNRVDDTLGRFAPELLDESYDDPEDLTINMSDALSTSMSDSYRTPADPFLTVPCVDISLHGGNIIFQDDQLPLLASVSKEKGLIAVAAYDFTDLSKFCEQHTDYVDNLFTSLLGENRINQLAEALYSGNSTPYWSIRNMIDTGDINNLPSVPLYMLELAIYVILIGPGLYIFLRQRELQQYYRSGIVILSLLFSGIIYLMGSPTRMDSMMYTYASFLDASEDTVNETTFINVRSPYSRPYELSLNSSYTVRPITKSFNQGQSITPRFTGEESYKTAIRQDSDQTVLTTQNISAFDTKYYQLSKIENNTDKLGFTGDITLFDGRLSGQITNNFGHSIHHTAILLYGQIAILGELPPGKTIDLANVALLDCPLNLSYIPAETISGGDAYLHADIDNQGYLEALERTNFLTFYLDNYANTYTTEAKIIGFASDITPELINSKSSEKAKGNTMVLSSLDVNFQENDIISRSALMKNPTVLNGRYDSAGNSIYGTEPLVLEYSLGNDIEIQKISFRYLSSQFTDNEKYSNVVPFTGNLYFYNHTSGNYDLMAPDQLEYSTRQLANYLSPGNTLTVKYVCSTSNDYNWDVILPMIMVIGSER